jgi:hypothetical protein
VVEKDGVGESGSGLSLNVRNELWRLVPQRRGLAQTNLVSNARAEGAKRGLGMEGRASARTILGVLGIALSA